MDAPTLLALILALPLAGFLFQVFLGGRIVAALGPVAGRRLCGGVSTAAVFAAFALSLEAAVRVSAAHGVPTLAPLFAWIDLASLRAPFELYLDPLSATMILVVTGVGGLIHLYATGYMADERDYPRFFAYMNLFVVAMLLLVLAGNLLLLFVGWEGVGLCSYLLIGFWYEDPANVRAANKAFIFNRIGDWGFMLGMFLVFVLAVWYGRGIADARYLSFDNLASRPELFASGTPMVFAAALLLFVGACGKSAQFPLYSWLPDAMAGPTPVSALIHAATMVTAGVVLLTRMHFVFEAAPAAGPIIAGVGAFTALFAAVIAFGQTDIKKVLAFSTVSQLGYMFVACGAGNYSAGIFHVVTHAFFKALLFLGAGAVIYSMAHEQDMRRYGNLRKYLPITTWTMVVAFLAISGFPLLSGFFSKEAILGSAIGADDALVRAAGFAALFTALLTAIYMARLTGLTFFGSAERWRAPHEAIAHPAAGPEPRLAAADALDDPHGFYLSPEELAAEQPAEHGHAALGPDFTPREAPVSMTLPLVVLAILSIGAGAAISALAGGDLSGWRLVAPSPIPPHAESPWLPWASGAAALLGMIWGLAIYARGLPESEGWDLAKWNPFRRAAGEQFGFDRQLVGLSVEAGKDVGSVLAGGIEPGLVEGGVNGLGMAVGAFGLLARKLQTGYVRFYALLMFVGVVGLLGWMLLLARGGGG